VTVRKPFIQEWNYPTVCGGNQWIFRGYIRIGRKPITESPIAERNCLWFLIASLF